MPNKAPVTPPPLRPEADPRKTAPAPPGAPRRDLCAALPDATLLDWLRMMLLIREFENRTAQAYQQAKIGGFCHLYTGQEASAVGTLAAVNPDDPVITAYRDHGHALARGMSPRACMAEMFGRITGCAKGKGGSMHMFDRPHLLFGGHGIVGAQMPLGVGIAFALRYERVVLKHRLDGGPRHNRLCLCYLGDGALNQGAFHEAMNLAGLFSLPIVFIVENNLYSMGTAIHRGTTMAHDLRRKADAYGIESRIINGFDILELYDHFKPFADVVRQEQRPGFVELKTYRYFGHSMSDPQKYRTREEVETWKERDSIQALARHLMTERRTPAGQPVLTEEAYAQMQQDVREVIRDAVEFAERSPAPDPARELYSDVFIYPVPDLSPIAPYVHGEKNPLL